MANEIIKTIPSTLDAEQQYAVRVRSINGLGVPSSWSESTIVDTTAAGLASARRLIINNDGMVAYDSNGRMIFNYASSTPAIRTNFVTNPSFEENTTGWTALTNTSVARITTDYFFGQVEVGRKASLEVTASSTSTAVGFVTATAQRMNATNGLAYTASVYVKIPVGQPKASFKVGLRFYDGGGTLIAEQVSAIAKEIDTTQNWVRLSYIGTTAPSGTAKMGFVIYTASQMISGSKWIADGVLVEQSAILRDYFDGSTSTGTSAWTGTANNSASTLDTNSVYSVNGGVFTESTIQTSRADFTGVKITKDGIRGYAPGATPVETFFLDAATGALSINGAGLPGGDSIAVGGAATDVNTNGTTIQGGKIRTGLLQSTSYSGVTDGSDFSTTGTTYNLDNGSITSKKFRVDTSGNAVFAGALSGATGTFSGTVSAGSAAFGPTVQPGKNGLYINANNYWYDSGNEFKVGNGSSSILWNGTNLVLVGSISSSATITGGTIQTAASGDRVVMSGANLTLYPATGNDSSSIIFNGGFTAKISSSTLLKLQGPTALMTLGTNLMTFYPDGSNSPFNLQPGIVNVTGNLAVAGSATGGTVVSHNYMIAKSGAPSAWNANACGYVFDADGASGLFNDGSGIVTIGVNGAAALTLHAGASGLFINGGFLPVGTGTHALRWDNTFGQVSLQVSSIKYKENVKVLAQPDVEKIVKSVRPIQFNWKARNKETKKQKDWRKWEIEYGFVVEELSEVDPHLVRWAENKETGELEPVSWDPSAMCAILMSAVQKLTARIEELESNV